MPGHIYLFPAHSFHSANERRRYGLLVMLSSCHLVSHRDWAWVFWQGVRGLDEGLKMFEFFMSAVAWVRNIDIYPFLWRTRPSSVADRED
jgi:hypothetical protein